MNIEKRVTRGIRALDEAHPGWEHEVNLEHLDQSSPTRCVVSQLANQLYCTALYAVFGDDPGRKWATRRGFELEHSNVHAYQELTQEWKQRIHERVHGAVTYVKIELDDMNRAEVDELVTHLEYLLGGQTKNFAIQSHFAYNSER